MSSLFRSRVQRWAITPGFYVFAVSAPTANYCNADIGVNDCVSPLGGVLLNAVEICTNESGYIEIECHARLRNIGRSAD